MAAWASLSGYLYFKPTGGALSRLKSRKRLWCVLDESKGQLVYHKSEEDARCKPPVGHIELRAAAITLDLDNQNQFVIIVDGKETYLTAENHESMMIWLVALQAKRDHFAKYESTERSGKAQEGNAEHPYPPSTQDPDGEDMDLQRERVGLTRGPSGSGDTPSSSEDVHPLPRPRGNTLGTSPRPARAASGATRTQRQRHSSTVHHRPLGPSHSQGLMADTTSLVRRPNRSSADTVTVSSSDVSVVREGGGHRSLCATKSLHSTPLPLTRPELQTAAAHLRRQQLRRLGESFDGGQSTKEVTGNTFHSFNRQLSISMESSDLLRQQQQPYYSRPGNNGPLPATSHGTNINFSLPIASTARMQETSSSGSTVDSDDISGEEHGKHHELSSLSASSADSAIDNGENPELTARVHELEKELINSKCELAKVMNRQACYTEILKQKDEIILDLDEKLSKLGGADMGYDSKKRSVQASKELQERIRILQNQNRFLNEEVRRLARLRSQEQSKIRDQEGKAQGLEADIELWKLQYVSLIQSSIRFTGTDTMDDAELSLYGGDRHKNKVKSLLDEARKINPSLPTYENLAAGEVHVDYHGFKHQFQDSGLLLHYLCQELTQHYLSQAAAQEQHQQNWQTYLRNNNKNLMKSRKDLKELCRGGIPDQYRRTMWRCFIHDKVSDLMVEKGPHYYRSLCSMLPDSPLAARYRKQISLDLMRTMPSNIKFSTPGSKGIMDLQDVLLAFCVHNPNIGYCQGMNFLVAMALLFMEAQDAFWTLVAVTERYHSVSYFDQNLLGAQADQSVLRDLLGDLLPELARHLEAIDIEISTVTLNWFLAIFFDAVPFPTLLRIWDCFLLEGPKVLFRFSLAILKLHEKEIVHKTETISVMRHLKACARVTYDVEGLVELAFRGFKNFPRRQDIASKQMVYLKALKEKYRWRELQKLAFAERENLFLCLESETGDSLAFECCAVSTSGEVWVCYGHQTQSRVCVVDCKESTMTDLSIKLTSRVMSLCAIEDGMLFGTLAWNIICYRETDRTLMWEQQLHDAVLSLCQFEDSSGCRVFAGLADGTVAVLENISTDTSFYDVMYIMVGQSPVTCLQLVDSKLWCACGNTVSIIQASTLDALDSFSVSSNPYDHILSLQPGLPGVWIAVRGSSILELWDPETLCCKMLYDTRAGRYPNLRKEDEAYFNKARITCILPLDLSVWVGTGEGSLITYDVFTHQGSKTPSDSSSFVGSYSEGFSAAFGNREEGGDGEDFDPVREAAMRVRQLYLSQQQQAESDDDHARLSAAVLSTTSTLVNSCESVGQHTGSELAPTLTTTPAPYTASEVERQEDSRDGADDTTLTAPRDVQGEGDSEGITPTASFCHQDSTYGSATDLVVVGECSPLQENKTIVGDAQTYSSEKGKSDTKEDSESTSVQKSIQDSEQTKSTPDVPSAENGKPLSHSEHKKGKPISSSPPNGVSKFYLGDEEQEDKVKKFIKNGSVPVDDSAYSNNKQNGASDMAAEKNLTSSESTKNEKNQSGKRTSEMTSRGGDPHQPQHSAEADYDLSLFTSGSKHDKKDRTSESGIDVASNDGSVIMQVWEAIRKSRSNTRSSHDTIEEDGDVKPSKNSSNKDGGKTTSGDKDGGSAASVEDGTASPERKRTLKESMGSSFASSVDSRYCQSESDDVFQDAADDIHSVSKKDGGKELSTAPESAVESQYETGADDAPSAYESGQDDAASRGGVSPSDSFHSLDRDGDSVDDVSKGQDERSNVKRKPRPQSLFVHRGSLKGAKGHTGMCVDRKTDKRAPGLNMAVSSPTFSHHVVDSFIHTVSAATATTTSKPITITSSGKEQKAAPNQEASAQAKANLKERAGSDSSVADNLHPDNPEAQYRLDYTNLHIDSVSDMESYCDDGGSTDSRRSSSVFSLGTTDTSKPHSGEDREYDGSSDGIVDDDDAADGRLRSLDCDPSSFIFPQDYYALREGSDVVGRAKIELSSQLLHTPALSTISCKTWSSYDEVSTPSRGDCESARSGRNSRIGSFGAKGYLPRNNSQLSTTVSIASTAELLYGADMTLLSKNKISDKPIKCLLLYHYEGKPIVLSFSGCHTDDEAVLKWTREKDEMLWTNNPILEYNPATKTTKLPTYMKARLSSSSSTQSKQPRFSQGSQGSQ